MTGHLRWTDAILAHPSVVTVGTFDGVHRGHQALLASMRSRAADLGARVVVTTFDPPPRLVLRPDSDYRLLTSLDERISLLRAYGADEVVVATFDSAFANRTAEEFCAELITRLRMVELVGGPDTAFGRGREGTADVLARLGAEMGFCLTVLPQVSFEAGPVRSGAIRAALRTGDVALATNLLGRPPIVIGEVVRGDQRGRTIGVPTANLALPRERIVPGNGVYAVRVTMADGRLTGVMNVGTRPTVDGARFTIEVHILDWDGDLYGQHVSVELIARLRDEKRFDTLAALVGQIHRDVLEARAILEEGSSKRRR